PITRRLPTGAKHATPTRQARNRPESTHRNERDAFGHRHEIVFGVDRVAAPVSSRIIEEGRVVDAVATPYFRFGIEPTGQEWNAVLADERCDLCIPLRVIDKESRYCRFWPDQQLRPWRTSHQSTRQ